MQKPLDNLTGFNVLGQFFGLVWFRRKKLEFTSASVMRGSKNNSIIGLNFLKMGTGNKIPF